MTPVMEKRNVRNKLRNSLIVFRSTLVWYNHLNGANILQAPQQNRLWPTRFMVQANTQKVWKWTYGNKASNTRCPVRSGWLAGSFSTHGRGWRTGHTCSMLYFFTVPSKSTS